MGESPLLTFLTSVVAHARMVRDPAWYRLALIAEGLIVRLRESEDGSLARLMGDSGPVALRTQTGTAVEALQQAQATLDSPSLEPDLATVKVGIAAVRSMVGNPRQRPGTSIHLFRLMMGKTGGLAPKHLTGPGEDVQP